MAFSVKIVNQASVECDDIHLELEVPWWSTEVLRSDPRFIYASSDGYANFDAIVSATELRVLHEQFKPLAFEGPISYSGWRTRVELVFRELERALELAPSTQRFRINVFEWESGLE